METNEPCSICGCTETNLVDGFYYCVECGTQDTNIRETVVEYNNLGEGAFVMASKKRISQIPKAKEVKMTDDWYKWHSLNFLLKGLADELIELGAAPSFKTKLLWLWTRYMKKYQNKADFGLGTNEESDDNEDEDKPTMDEKAYSSDEEEHTTARSKTFQINIEKISMPLLLSFLYVALNLDKSHIQLTHLIRFIREGRVSIMEWWKLVPKEIKPKMLLRTLLYDNKCIKYSFEVIRVLAMELFKKLDLGNPVVPDLRPLVEEYLQELCLPNDLKPLVFSLMHYRSFDYLDINVKYKGLRKMPPYELHVISHILLALKICFGLDCEYEVKLSNAVDKINDLEDHPKSYDSQPTDRLFNFRDWCSYIHFRKSLLRTHTLHLGEPNYFDMNDYVAFEHQRERRDFKKTLKDEIAMDIINKIQSPEINVIPRSEFVSTLTPHATYTHAILEHQQDPNVKQLLSEDFTQYSLKYIIKDMFLVDLDSANPRNLIAGVNERNMQEFKKTFSVVDPEIVLAKGMVYVKDCDNHNWMVTQRPQLEHVSIAEKMNETEEKENDHGYISNSETLQNIMNINNRNLDDTHKSIEARGNSVMAIDNNNEAVNDLGSTTNIEMETEKEERSDDAIVKDLRNIDEDIKLLQIREEDPDINIFDDNFVDLGTKKEKDKDPEENESEYNDNEAPCEVNRSINLPDTFRYDLSKQDYRTDGKESDNSSIDSIRLNPESLDRDKAIKELIIHACNKLKVSLPGKYIWKAKRKNKYVRNRANKVEVSFKGDTKQKVNNLISAYQTHLQEDIFNQMSNMVQEAIVGFNESQESEMPMESEDLPPIDAEIDAANNQTIENEVTNTNEEQNLDQNETVASGADDKQYNLFGDSSDGEAHAEDLLPKKNPEFDEETHDISQLYIKPTENQSAPQMSLNPKLFKIIDRKIEEDKNEETSQEQVNTEVSNSDSEEDVSISVLQEQKRLREQLTEQKRCTKDLRPLIQSEIAFYKIWVRHYNQKLVAVSALNQRFANEMDAKLPKSFVFVLKECADVVGYPPFLVYKRLQRVEGCIKDKYVNRKRFDPSYFVNQPNSKKKKNF